MLLELISKIVKVVLHELEVFSLSLNVLNDCFVFSPKMYQLQDFQLFPLCSQYTFQLIHMQLEVILYHCAGGAGNM